MYKPGDHVHVEFDAVIVEGDEACTYVTVTPGPGDFGIPHGDTVMVHFQHVMLIKPV